MEDGPKRMGFYTTRIIEAPDAEAAELAAVEMLRGDERLRGNVNDPSDSPVLHAEEVSEIADADPSLPNAGYAFFEHDETQ